MRIKTSLPRSNFRRGRQQLGLTLLEITVATGLLAVIVLGLTAMFVQTQKAFRAGLRQTDVLEGARAVADMVARDLEQLADAGNTNAINYFAVIRTNDIPPIIQNDNNNQPLRTNGLTDVFFLARNSVWNPVGYAVKTNMGGLGIGTLYRYGLSSLNGPIPMSANFTNALYTQFLDFTGSTNWMTNRISDGVIHFAIRALDTNGVEIPYVQNLSAKPYLPVGYFYHQFPILSPAQTNLPSVIEVELGVLEPATLEQVRAMGNITVQTSFLAGQAGKVHIFRQQIPIRSVPR